MSLRPRVAPLPAQEAHPSPWSELVPPVVAVVLYARAAACGFALDDRVDLLENRFVTGPFDPAGILTSEFYGGWGHLATGHYRPLVSLTNALVARVFGLIPAPFHVLNVALFAMVVLLTGRLVARLSGDRLAGTLAALLLAVHPIVSESVAAIAGLKELASAALGLAALWRHRVGRERAAPGGTPWSSSLAAFGLFLAALLYKETALAFLAAAVAAEILFPLQDRARSLAASVASVWPLAAAAGIWLLVRTAVTGGLFRPTIIYSIDNPLVLLPAGFQRIAALGLLPRYLALVVWPSCLSSDYSDGSFPLTADAADPWILAGCVAAVVLVSALVFALRCGARTVAFGLAVFAAAYLLVSNLVVPIGTIMAERLFFVPFWGLAVAAGGAGAMLWGWAVSGARVRLAPTALGVTAVCVAAVFAGRTVVRIGDWKDNAALSVSLARCHPDNLKGLVVRSEAAARAGRREEARALLQRALEIRPGSSFVQASLGRFLLDEDDARGAERALRASAEGSEPIPGAVVSLAMLCLDTNRPAEAAGAARRALQAQPSFADAAAAHLVLGEVALRGGDFASAEGEFRAALREDPGDPAAHFDLGRILESRGQWLGALAEFTAAEATVPRERLPDLLAARAQAEDALGRKEAATRTRARIAALPAPEVGRTPRSSLRPPD